MSDFVHLRVRSQYSLLASTIRPRALFETVRALGMSAVAITDYGGMFGVIDLYESAVAAGVKLIFGCELYVVSGDHRDRVRMAIPRLVVLARNETGFKNLLALASAGHLEGFYYVPRVSKQLVRAHSAGLIGLSAGWDGEIGRTWRSGKHAQAETVAREYASMFARGDFYVELGFRQGPLNREMHALAGRLGLPVVATGDCAYLERADSAVHQVVEAVRTESVVNLDHIRDSERWVRSPAEMAKTFASCPEALASTVDIANRCNVTLRHDSTLVPALAIDGGESPDARLAHLVEVGLERRLQGLADAGPYRDRCRYEIDVVQRLGLASYFLIVWEYVDWARQHRIRIGPGRGSSAGSIVAWALCITGIDPIRFKLPFERFINPDRTSYPDLQIDICARRRDEVVEHIRERYGRDRVGAVAEFHEYHQRGAVRDVARATGLNVSDELRLAALVPDDDNGTPSLRQLGEDVSDHRDLFTTAAALVGLPRSVGAHPSGIAISNRPLAEHVPCFPDQTGHLITQVTACEVERVGLVVFSLHPLETLTLVQDVVGLVNGTRADGDLIDIDAIRADDADVFAMLSRGDTEQVFQLESTGMRALLMKVEPRCLEDLDATIALFRPGPLDKGMVDDFIERRHGRVPREALHPLIEPILADTYGVVVYQEQVMEIAHVVAGYTLAQGDLLRRMLGKKKPADIAEAHERFLTGARKNGVDEESSHAIFDQLARNAGYGFNRAHSTAYGWLSYQTAYLKHHFPEEFDACYARSP